jgi:hypothetical protein
MNYTVNAINGKSGVVTIKAADESINVTNSGNSILLKSNGGGQPGPPGPPGPQGPPGDLTTSGVLTMTGGQGLLLTTTDGSQGGGTVTWRAWNLTRGMIQNITITNEQNLLIFHRADGAEARLEWIGAA